LGLLGLLIVILAPIHDSGDRRVGIGRDFHEIQAGGFGGGQGFGAGQNAELTAVITNNAQVSCPY
jgi:hypothetical protein